jgi:sulfur carrier protein
VGSIPITRSRQPPARGRGTGRPPRGALPRAQMSVVAAMDIVLNGEPRTVPPGASPAHLIELLALRGGRIAIEVNGTIVPRSRHAEHELQPGDRVEIVHAVGGG